MMKHRWLRHFPSYRDLETNPETQLRVHILGQRFWILNMPLFIGWFFLSPATFVAGGVLLTGVYSLYANWATDNGAAASIRADMNTSAQLHPVAQHGPLAIEMHEVNTLGTQNAATGGSSKRKPIAAYRYYTTMWLRELLFILVGALLCFGILSLGLFNL